MVAHPVYILDNGACSLKVGLSTEDKPKVVPNAIMKAKSERRRLFVGNDIDECRDTSSLYYILPFQKGYLINWETEKTIWDHTFSKNCCPVSFSDTPLIFTEPLFNFQPLQEGANEIFFEEYDCNKLLRINAVDLTCYK
jgi:actin-related protein 6